jgi:hypothetical protein
MCSATRTTAAEDARSHGDASAPPTADSLPSMVQFAPRGTASQARTTYDEEEAVTKLTLPLVSSTA